MTTEQIAPTVVDNRTSEGDATKDDAVVLALLYTGLTGATKTLKKALKAIVDGFVRIDADMGELRDVRDAAQAQLDELLDQAWIVLNELPAGTNAAGGASTQTVGLEFFHGGLNRNLKLRMTAGTARALNKAAFGG